MRIHPPSMFAGAVCVGLLGLVLIATSHVTMTPGQQAGSRDAVPEEYSYLYQGGVGNDELQDVRERLPFEKIELEYFSPWIWGGDKITLWRDGRAALADRKGRWSGEASILDYGRLCYLIDDHGFSSLEPKYEWNGFDATTTTIRVWRVDQEEPIVVEDYGSVGPIDLWAIEASIKGVARTIRWEEAAQQGDTTDPASAGR